MGRGEVHENAALVERLKTHFDDCPPVRGEHSFTRSLLFDAATHIERIEAENGQLYVELGAAQAERDKLLEALKRIEVIETDYAAATDDNMERVRIMARQASAQSSDDLGVTGLYPDGAPVRDDQGTGD